MEHLGDLLTRLQNSYKMQLRSVVMHPSTPNYCLKVLEVLRDEGYVRSFSESISKDGKTREIEVTLKYNANGVSALSKAFQVSKRGRRVYAPVRALWRRQSGRGIFILSTPQGVRSDTQARLRFLGGEILCGVY